MIAGYDTTSNALTYCSYILAKHPEELSKLQEEIDGMFHVESQSRERENIESAGLDQNRDLGMTHN